MCHAGREAFDSHHCQMPLSLPAVKYLRRKENIPEDACREPCPCGPYWITAPPQPAAAPRDKAHGGGRFVTRQGPASSRNPRGSSLEQQKALLPSASTGELSSLASRARTLRLSCGDPDIPLSRLTEGLRPWSHATAPRKLALTLSLPASSSSSDQNSVGALPELSRYSEPVPARLGFAWLWARTMHGSDAHVLGLKECAMPCSPTRGFSSADVRLWFGLLTPGCLRECPSL